LAFAIDDERGNYVAILLGKESSSAEYPFRFAIEGVLGSYGRPAVVEAPTEKFTDDRGIVYFPPEVVDIRGYRGILLRQERVDRGGVPAMQTIVWLERNMYWKISGWDPQSAEYYTPEMLLEIANQHLVQWDHALSSWQPVK
jgi:hypothetical protein